MSMGIPIIIAKRVPLVPDDIPANQNPIKRQIIAINLSLFFENFQLAKQNIETPKTAIENGIAFPENISNLPIKCSVRPNRNAKLCEKAIYTINVVAIAVLA